VEHLTVGEISGVVALLGGLIGGIISLIKYAKNGLKSMLKDEFQVVNNQIEEVKEDIKEEPPITIVYTKTGERADQWIERKTRELRIDHFIDIIVVSDDHDERDTTLGYGAILRDCHMFIKELKDRKQNVSKITKKHNSRELKNRHIRMSDKDRRKLENFIKNGKF